MMSRYAILLALCAALLCACGSCTRTVYTPVESTTVRTDTLYRAVVRVDTILQRDSVTVMQRGDTVMVTRYRDRYRVKLHTDTVREVSVDSVRVAVPYPVERELTRWEQAKMDFGGMALGGLVIALCAAVAWLIKKYRR